MLTIPQVLRVILVEPQLLLRSCLRAALSEHSIDVVAESHSSETLLELCQELRPDLVILALEPPFAERLGPLCQLQSQLPEQATLVLSHNYCHKGWQQARLLKAKGYLNKSCLLPELISAIRKTAGGGFHYASDPPRSAPARGLSERQKRILQGLALGKTNCQLAHELRLSPSSVKLEIRNLFETYRCHDRTQLASQAILQGFTPPSC